MTMTYSAATTLAPLTVLLRPGVESVGDDAGMEALAIAARMGDLFMRALYGFRTNVLHRFRDFRRSELRMVNEKQAVSLKALFANPAIPLDRILVPIPDGMQVPYLEAATALNDLQIELDLASTLDRLEKYFDQTKAEGELSALTDDTRALQKAVGRLSKEQVEKQLRVCFNDERNERDVLASHVIASSRELIQVNGRILTFERYFLDAVSVEKRITALEKKIDALVQALSTGGGVVDKEYCTALQGLITTAAVQLDMYGVILHEQQRVEHNFALALQNILDADRRQR